MRIQHNIPALNAYRYMATNQNALSKSLEKLSSGYKINRAADDAAGLAISEKMRAQISGLGQAQKNAKDGISLIQTGEGALTEIHDMLNRVKTLTEQAANGTYDDNVDREQIQMEVRQISEEVDRITATANFNGIKLFQNEGAAQQNRSTDLEFDLAKLLNDLDDGSGELKNILFSETIFDESLFTTTQTAFGANTVTSKYASLANTLQTQIVPQVVNAITKQYSAFSYLNGSSIGMGLRLYNNPKSATVASVTGGLGKSGSSYYQTYQLSINVAYVGNLNTTAGRNALERVVSHEMIHAFMDETHTSGMFGRTSSLKITTPFPKWFTEGMAQTASGPLGYVTSKNALNLNSSSSLVDVAKALMKSSNKLSSNTNVSKYGTGYLACMYLGYMAAGETINLARPDDAAKGITKGLSTVLTELAQGSSLNSVIQKYTNFTSTSDMANRFGNVSSARNFVRSLLRYATDTTGGIISGNLTSGNPVSNSTLTGLNLFQLNTTKQTVKNVYPSSVTVISGGSTNTAGKAAVSGMLVSVSALENNDDSSDDSDTNAASGSVGGIKLQIGTTADETLEISRFALSSASLGLDKLDVSTEDGAISASAQIDDMINRISTIRGVYGAMQNRLEHTINHLSVMQENLQDAESVIRDTDVADEMMKYTKNSILVQSVQAMLAQANQLPQGVLQMLG